jgi:hypothetical protein
MLCYSCFLGAIFYRQSIHFMPKRKVINPLVFKRNNAPRKPTLTSTSSTRKKTYRWIGFDGSVKVIDEDSIHQEEERERVLRLTVEENKWRNKGYTVIVGVDEAVSLVLACLIAYLFHAVFVVVSLGKRATCRTSSCSCLYLTS